MLNLATTESLKTQSGATHNALNPKSIVMGGNHSA